MMMTLLIGVLAFLVLGGLGFALAGGESAQTKAVKRAQSMVGGGGTQAVRARARVAANSPDIRRKQILKMARMDQIIVVEEEEPVAACPLEAGIACAADAARRVVTDHLCLGKFGGQHG